MNTQQHKQSGRAPLGRAAALRVVVVTEGANGTGDVVRDLAERDAAVAEPVFVPTFLSAMGELAAHRAEAVIVPLSSLAGLADAAVPCLRELSPHTRVVVTADDAADAAALRQAGVDVVLTEPITPEVLQVALQAHGGSQSNPQQPSAPPAVPGSPEPSALSPWDTPPPEVASVDADTDLGDVDLVEAMLDDAASLPALAVRIIAARSGLAGIGFAAESSAVPATSVTTPVRYLGQELGWLHGPADTDEATLAPWAAWLGRWLALQRQMTELETLSMRDELTGVWNRRYFMRFLEHILERASRDRSQVTLLMFDIDDFKIYNDRYGHAAGDEILREASRLMQSVVRDHDVVARIGGDEFAVIFWDAGERRHPASHHPDSVRKAAKRFQQAICTCRFPKLLNEAAGTLTISGGLASFPWDGRTPAELLGRADVMALRSKRQGKNAITFGPGALRQAQQAHAADGEEGA